MKSYSRWKAPQQLLHLNASARAQFYAGLCHALSGLHHLASSSQADVSPRSSSIDSESSSAGAAFSSDASSVAETKLINRPMLLLAACRNYIQLHVCLIAHQHLLLMTINFL